MKELYRFRQFLAEGKLFEEDNTTYALHITTVEYDNGKPGYTYEVVDLDTEEEVGSKFGFKPLYFVGSGDEGDQQVFKGQDFNSIKTYGMYQDEVVNKEQSLEIYKGLINGEDFSEKLSFDPRDLAEGRLLKEGIPQESEIADYVEAMFNDSVVEKEGFQSDIWTKEEYAATSRDEGSVFMDLAKHLNSVGGKDVLEGNPDIHLELLSNGDIQWSADVTFD